MCLHFIFNIVLESESKGMQQSVKILVWDFHIVFHGMFVFVWLFDCLFLSSSSFLFIYLNSKQNSRQNEHCETYTQRAKQKICN